MFCMSSKPKIARDSKSGRWTYVKLKDGRQIASPVSGGKISKLDIRKAVKGELLEKERLRK